MRHSGGYGGLGKALVAGAMLIVAGAFLGGCRYSSISLHHGYGHGHYRHHSYKHHGGHHGHHRSYRGHGGHHGGSHCW